MVSYKILSQLKYKPRIGVDARPLSYGLTGNSRYLAEALRKLTERESPFEFYLYSNKILDPVFEDLLQRPGIYVPPSPAGLGVLWLNFSVPKLLVRDEIDIFWGTLQLLPAKKLPIPSCVNYHDLNFISAPETMTFSNYWQHRVLSGRTLSKADMVFCLSENTKNDIAKYRPDTIQKLKVIYPGCEKLPSPVTPSKSVPKKFIFSIGTLEPRKNVKTLISGFTAFKKQYPDTELSLVLAGRLGWREEELTQKLKSGEWEKDGIYFIENPTDAELSYLYENCEIFAFPSKHEGFGLPLLEAIQAGKRCVASDIPVFREILEEGIDTFANPDDPNSWVEAIYRSEQMHPKKRHWKKDFWSYKRTAMELESSFLELWEIKKVKEKP